MCNCILCFLDESNHFEWRKESQKDGIHNHQHLSNYKHILLEKINKIGPIIECPIHQGVHEKFILFWDNAQKDIPFKTLISDFLQYIEIAYQKWNDGYVVEATQMFEKMISLFEKKKYTMLDRQIPYILFRNRIQFQKKKFTKESLWHIPFNKRFLVPNYRFSISGRPMLYLGSSVCDILYEMRQENENLRNLKNNMLSVFVLKHSKKKNGEELKIFDLTNPFTRSNSNLNMLTKSGVVIDYYDTTFGKWSELISLYVKLLVLMSCCSFSTCREEVSFHEEYIIPQLLTEVLCKRGYDAIKYSSTRLNPSFCKNDSSIWAINSLRENYVFFTHFTEFEKYDLGLKYCFENSRPHPYVTNSLINVVLKKLSFKKKANKEKVDDWLTRRAKFIICQGQCRMNSRLNDTDIMNYTLVPYQTLRRNATFKGKNYWDTDYGKIEFDLLKIAAKEGLI